MFVNWIEIDEDPKADFELCTSVHKGEELQSQLSNHWMENKLEAEHEGQPTNKQHSSRNDRDRMPKLHTNLSIEEKFKFLQSIDVEVRNLEDKFKQV